MKHTYWPAIGPDKTPLTNSPCLFDSGPFTQRYGFVIDLHPWPTDPPDGLSLLDPDPKPERSLRVTEVSH